ncbi:MAG: hypothetical protein EBT20_07045 [Alphaproteobacteria bacterium]|nr:hypothetical protein [Alphaproteobacteria bacterium]
MGEIIQQIDVTTRRAFFLSKNLFYVKQKYSKALISREIRLFCTLCDVFVLASFHVFYILHNVLVKIKKMPKHYGGVFMNVFFWKLSGFIMGFLMMQTTAWSGDIELGEYLAQECMGCHQSHEIVGNVPIIHGLDAAYFIEAMNDYRDGFRENQTMNLVATSLSKEDVEALAAYFALQQQK